jgi:hypothetical protein
MMTDVERRLEESLAAWNARREAEEAELRAACAEPSPRELLRNTIALLSYLRRFLRSDCRECVDPSDPARFGRLTKDEARRHLHYLLDVAINRRNGMSDEPFPKCADDYQLRLRRDQSRLQDMARRVRVYQFETSEVRRRFGHLLVSRED